MLLVQDVPAEGVEPVQPLPADVRGPAGRVARDSIRRSFVPASRQASNVQVASVGAGDAGLGEEVLVVVGDQGPPCQGRPRCLPGTARR